MGYYCTVPQCTSLAGKTKNVKFHRFPRDELLAHRWNEILHRNKPFTKYSKVCSLHFTQSDYNITTMGQWKTLSKDAIPTQNLPRLNADGSVMVIRKSRSLKYKPDQPKKDADHTGEKREWMNTSGSSYSSSPGSASLNTTFNTSDTVPQRLSSLNSIAHAVSPLQTVPPPAKHDAIMQTDRERDVALVPQRLSSLNSIANTVSPLRCAAPPVKHDAIMQTEPVRDVALARQPEDKSVYIEIYTQPKTYSKEDDYSTEAETYALERRRRPSYEDKTFPADPLGDLKHYKINYAPGYQKLEEFKASFDRSSNESFESREYAEYCPAEILKNQQQNIHTLQMPEDGEERFYSGRIKEEIDNCDDKFAYENGPKEADYASSLLQQQQRLMDFYERRPPIKSEPHVTNGESVMQPQAGVLAEYYRADQQDEAVSESYYQPPLTRPPGAELLIAKQNALAATLWQNSMKRPFYYSEAPHNQLNTAALHARYEEPNRLINQ